MATVYRIWRGPGTQDVSFYSVDGCDDTMVRGASPASDAPAGMKHLRDYFAFQIGTGRSRRGLSLNCSPRLGKPMPSNCGVLQA